MLLTLERRVPTPLGRRKLPYLVDLSSEQTSGDGSVAILLLGGLKSMMDEQKQSVLTRLLQDLFSDEFKISQ